MKVASVKRLPGTHDPSRFYNLNSKDFSDETIWEDVCRGSSNGVFQLETKAMESVAKRLQPKSERDVADLISINRPGVIRAGMLDAYLNRRQGKDPVDTPHPLVSGVLEDTLGICVYQEQVMQICRVVAGYTAVEAGKIRKILGKRKYDEMQAEKPKFIRGCVANDEFIRGCGNRNPAIVADEIWRMIEASGSYSFNRSHGQAYALLSTWEVWAKKKHLPEYLTALMRTDKDRVSTYVREARRKGVKILPPDINDSKEDFVLTAEGVRWGLTDVKGLGASAVKEIIENQPYSDFEDYLNRTSSRAGKKKNVLESLIRIGAFDKMGDRSEILEKFYLSRREKNYSIPDFHDDKVVLDTEIELVGTYITKDPMEPYIPMIEDLSISSPEAIDEFKKNEKFVIGGQVSLVKEHKARNGIMAFVEVTYQDEVYPVTVFANTYGSFKKFLVLGDPVMITCQKLDEGCHALEIVNLKYLD